METCNIDDRLEQGLKRLDPGKATGADKITSKEILNMNKFEPCINFKLFSTFSDSESEYSYTIYSSKKCVFAYLHTSLGSEYLAH